MKCCRRNTGSGSHEPASRCQIVGSVDHTRSCCAQCEPRTRAVELRCVWSVIRYKSLIPNPLWALTGHRRYNIFLYDNGPSHYCFHIRQRTRADDAKPLLNHANWMLDSLSIIKVYLYSVGAALTRYTYAVNSFCIMLCKF